MTRLMYDSVNPYAIPANAEVVAGYIDGTSYRWEDHDWDRFPNAVKVRIARRVTTNDGHVLDVEAGIPTVWPPTQAIVDWVKMRRRSGVEPTIYCNQLNDWETIRALFTSADVREPYWWVARYNNVASIPVGAIAKQYANPPLAGGHYDLSVVADYWPGVDDGLKGIFSMLTENEQRDLYNRIMGAMPQRWERRNAAGDVIESTYNNMWGVDGWTASHVLDSADGNTIMKRLEALEQKIGALFGNGVTFTPEGAITIRASQSGNDPES